LNSTRKADPSSASDGRYYRQQRNSHPKSRLVHNATIVFCIGAWALSNYLNFHTHIKGWISLGIGFFGFFGFVPYLLSVYFVEPWISRKFTDRANGK
jgi:Na+/proline symporter